MGWGGGGEGVCAAAEKKTKKKTSGKTLRYGIAPVLEDHTYG